MTTVMAAHLGLDDGSSGRRRRRCSASRIAGVSEVSTRRFWSLVSRLHAYPMLIAVSTCGAGHWLLGCVGELYISYQPYSTQSLLLVVTALQTTGEGPTIDAP